MAQGTLRNVQLIRRFGEATAFMDRFDRAQVTKLDMHINLMLMMNFMNLLH
jgi:hypothetical protein